MNIEILRQNLKKDLEGRGHELTRAQIGQIVESISIVEANGIATGDDISRLLKELPQLENHIIDEIERVTIIEAARYVYEDWLKQELSSTANELFVAQFGDGFSPAENAGALLKDAQQAMEAYWPTDEAGLGPLELRRQMDALAEAEGIASNLVHDPDYAHPLINKLALVCQQSDAFRERFAKRWVLAKDVVDHQELFKIDRSLGYTR